jgi:predicted phage tail protein
MTKCANLRTVRLYGKLGTKFGRTFRLAVNSPAEAVRALCVLLPGFETYLTKAKDNGMAFSVFVGKRNIGEDQLHTTYGSDDIRIAPMILGSKKAGVFQFIIGLVVTCIGIYTRNPSLTAQGAAMMIGGVIQMLSPMPKTRNPQDSPENQAGYVFNGAVNTQAQGNPVPLLYGRLIVGSAVISAGIATEDILVPIKPDPYDGNLFKLVFDKLFHISDA